MTEHLQDQGTGGKKLLALIMLAGGLFLAACCLLLGSELGTGAWGLVAYGGLVMLLKLGRAEHEIMLPNKPTRVGAWVAIPFTAFILVGTLTSRWFDPFLDVKDRLFTSLIAWSSLFMLVMFITILDGFTWAWYLLLAGCVIGLLATSTIAARCGFSTTDPLSIMVGFAFSIFVLVIGLLVYGRPGTWERSDRV